MLCFWVEEKRKKYTLTNTYRIQAYIYIYIYIYCVIFDNYTKFKNLKISYIFQENIIWFLLFAVSLKININNI